MNNVIMTRTRQIIIPKTVLLYFKMLANRCGIDLEEYEEQAIYNRLIKRIRFLHLENFEAYCARLRIDIEEEIKFINLITNTTTYFFRENHHFEFLAKYILSSLIKKQNKIRIWSAGCSIGVEAYSIAMVIAEILSSEENNYDIKILATDINSDALIQAKEGIYTSECIKKINLNRRNKWLNKIEINNEIYYQVKDQLKQMITFNQLNLTGLWPMQQLFDIIFCRNVIIYFKPNVSKMLLARFYKILKPAGILILGHSENLQDQKIHFINLDKTVYQKIDKEKT